MKYKNILTSKLNIVIIMTIFALATANSLEDPTPPKVNIYKEDKEVHNSLFRERDSIERMSQDTVGIPAPRAE